MKILKTDEGLILSVDFDEIEEYEEKGIELLPYMKVEKLSSLDDELRWAGYKKAE